MSKFLSFDNRLEIQKGLKESESFKSIARRLDKDPTTISREIRKHLSEVATGYPGLPYNACKNRFNCRKKSLCGKECHVKSAQYCKLCRD